MIKKGAVKITPKGNRRLFPEMERVCFFLPIKAVDNFSLKNAYTNHNRRKIVFLRKFLGAIQPAALAGFVFANLLKWYLCRLKPQLIRVISKITLFMPLLRNRSYPRFAFISP